MNRYQSTCSKVSRLAACVAIALAGCGEGPNLPPRPPQSPPRPVMEAGMISTANLVLTARPVPPKPGMM
ncbi:hypothetical protein EGT07_24675 [Herbaspirillum sp. HC18]|nr:hypothetical protein EGT07_24675 [Herbaspirillum sp. HC18]